jgi:hypothetical protein
MDANSVLAGPRARQGLLLGHLKRPLAVAHAVHQLSVARSCHRLLQCEMNERRLLRCKDFSNWRSSFLSASEGNALSS